MALQADWVRIGQPLQTFWDQTHRTFAAAVKGYLDRIEDSYRQLAWHAWHVGRLSQMDPKYHPTIPELLGEAAPIEEQMVSNEHLMVEMRKLGKRLGFEIEQVD